MGTRRRAAPNWNCFDIVRDVVMKLNRNVVKAVAVACSTLMLTACGDIVVKVEKKPKNVDLSQLENFSALNLQNSEDFLKHIDSLKVVAVDLLIKELARRDYRSEVRSAIRNYRTFLIERSTKEVKVDDSFYYGTDACRKTGLSFNMDEANNFLGIILKTAVLAKMSEVNAAKINPGLSKEIAAIGQLILMELGLKIEGDVNVENADDTTKTTGTFALSLNEIVGEEIDEETKKRDAIEVLTMTFTRDLGDNYVGSFNALIEIAHTASDASVETLQAKMDIERKAIEDRFVHRLAFQLGVKDGAVNYARNMDFEQVKGEQHKVKISDTLYPNTAEAHTFVTLLDIQAGTQCKINLDGTDNATKKGDEGGFIPEEPKAGKPNAETPIADEPKTEEPKTEVPTTDDIQTTKDSGGKPDNDDDKIDDTKGQNNPGQNPTQSPNQSPSQN